MGLGWGATVAVSGSEPEAASEPDAGAVAEPDAGAVAELDAVADAVPEPAAGGGVGIGAGIGVGVGAGAAAAGGGAAAPEALVLVDVSPRRPIAKPATTAPTTPSAATSHRPRRGLIDWPPLVLLVARTRLELGGPAGGILAATVIAPAPASAPPMPVTPLSTFERVISTE